MSDESKEQGRAFERDELVRALQARERFLTGVLGNLEAFVTIDEAWRLTYANAAVVQLAQLPAEELLGRDIRELTPPPVLEQALPFLEKAMLEAAAAEFDASYAATGATFRVSACPLADGGLALYARDVTDQARSERVRRDAEEALRESEERLRSVLTNSRDVIYRVDLRTGRYDYISPSAERTVGFSVAELAALDAQRALDLVHPEDQALLRQAVRSSTERGEAAVEYRQRTKGGGSTAGSLTT